MGREWAMSYWFLGFAFGGFMMSWHITTYLLESYRFPFMANLQRPFAMFCLNNSIIPFVYILVYSIALIRIESIYDDFTWWDIAIKLGSFLLGILTIVGTSAMYFHSTNSNISNFVKKAIEPKLKQMVKSMKTNAQDKWRVDTYFSFKLNTRITRDINKYDASYIVQVFKQHHYNFFIAQGIIIFIFFILGFLVEYPLFQIPAGCSLIFLLGLVMVLAGFFKFWTNRWSTLVFIILLTILNYSPKLGLSLHDNFAFGLNYDKPLQYRQDVFDSLTTTANIEADRLNTLEILQNWKAKQSSDKPKLIIITASGGGLTSTLFTTRILQTVNTKLNNQLFDRTALMTGASGGVIGLTYMRELFHLQKKQKLDINDVKYSYLISQDLLNPMCVTNLTHDILFPIQKFEYNNQSYRKDRAYMFEWTLNKNTNGILDKKISDYQQEEKSGQIPLLFNNSTVLNEYRQFIISSQPIRYMMKPYSTLNLPDRFETDMLDFCSFFESNGGKSIKQTTALRMTATYPFILPSVVLPTQPQIAVMDGGMRDNTGMQIIYKFIDVFQDWIIENTGGVVIIQVKYFPKFKPIKNVNNPSFFEKFISPLAVSTPMSLNCKITSRTN
ncbi:MAG: hypothetical protein IPK03_02350 [Bacteroidetes bacterium]|nr:hypothetical protein [Bacteroidota bacterium]